MPLPAASARRSVMVVVQASRSSAARANAGADKASTADKRDNARLGIGIIPSIHGRLFAALNVRREVEPKCTGGASGLSGHEKDLGRIMGQIRVQMRPNGRCIGPDDTTEGTKKG